MQVSCTELQGHGSCSSSLAAGLISMLITKTQFLRQWRPMQSATASSSCAQMSQATAYHLQQTTGVLAHDSRHNMFSSDEANYQTYMQLMTTCLK